MLQSYKKYKRISSVKATVILLIVAALAVLVTWGVWSLWDFVADPIEHEESFDAIIEKAARRNNLPPELVRAVIWRESKFNRHTIGKDGEVGLMQIRPETAVIDWAKYKKRHVPSKGALMDPELNIEIGSWYLGRAMRYWAGYKDQIALALCEYNAGRKRALEWKPKDKNGEVIGNIAYKSTREYVGDILRKYNDYRSETAKKREDAAKNKKK